MSLLLERPVTHVPVHRYRATETRFWTADRILGLVSALVGTVCIAWGVGLFPALLGDEGIYTNQAATTLHGQLTPYTYTYDHPFFGWLQLAPVLAIVRLFAGGDQLTVVSGRIAMVLFAFVSLVLVYHILRRLPVRRWLCVAGVVALGLSPLFVTESRQVLLDNIALPWVLGAFCLALSPRRRQWSYGMAGVLFGVGVLSKETVLLVLSALAYLVWTRAYRPIRAMCVAAFVTLGVLVVAIYPLFALLRGEFFPGAGHVSLWSDGIMYQLADRKGSGTVWQAGSSRRGVVDSWLLYDRGLLLIGAACGLVCLLLKRTRFVGLAIVLWAVPVIKPGGYLPQMYVILVIPFCLIAIVALFDAGCNLYERVLPKRVASAICVAMAMAIGFVVATHYVPWDRRVTTDQSNDAVLPSVQAESYLKSRVANHDNVLLDPAYWNDMVEAGLDHPWHGAIDYYEFDLDPVSSKKFLPHGWKDIDYIVETQEMRDNVEYLGLSNLAAAIAHSSIVASFGEKKNRVIIRAVRPTAYNNGGAQ